MGCFQSIVIQTPVDDVWRELRDFYGRAWCEQVITSLEPQNDMKGDQVGARRLLNGVFLETLIEHDDQQRLLRYTIDDGPDVLSKDKVQGYIGLVRVFEVTEGNGTFVAWSSQWDQSEGGVAEFCNPIYRALLGSLKAFFDKV